MQRSSKKLTGGCKQRANSAFFFFVRFCQPRWLLKKKYSKNYESCCETRTLLSDHSDARVRTSPIMFDSKQFLAFFLFFLIISRLLITAVQLWTVIATSLHFFLPASTALKFSAQRCRSVGLFSRTHTRARVHAEKEEKKSLKKKEKRQSSCCVYETV